MPKSPTKLITNKEKDLEIVLSKLERLNLDQELLIKSLKLATKEEEKMRTIENLVEKTLQKVNQSQQVTIEKVSNLESNLDRITDNHRRINYTQNELKIEITNRTYLLNELNKDLDELTLSYLRSGRSPAKLLNLKLDDLSKELFIIGVNQNTFSSSLDDYKIKLLNEIKKLKLDITNLNDKKDKEKTN